ncbi:hypothetical protein [Nakamurella deserti]|uniref:hypothetical protein n=1 Tax=Nakamurella deserti TaxID=2164074 RepID=UPI000DBE3BC1|nr:hypothetical protein [Nakamurella deserti]
MTDQFDPQDAVSDDASFTFSDDWVGFSTVLPPGEVSSLERSAFADWAWAVLRTRTADGEPGWCTRASEHCQPAELLGVLTRQYRSILTASVAAWTPSETDVGADIDEGSVKRELVPVNDLVDNLATTPLDADDTADGAFIVLKVIFEDGLENDGFRVIGDITDEELIGALAVQIELLQVQLSARENDRPV